MEHHSRGSVLVVDDEPTIAEVVARYLDRAGYATSVAHDGTQALACAAHSRPDLVVLDLMLPGIDGLEVMRRLRDRDPPPIGVILLTARGEESDRVIGLRLGADDYVVKPFSPAELVARVDAVLRRVEKPLTRSEPLQFGEIRIDPTARAVTVGEQDVLLTPPPRGARRDAAAPGRRGGRRAGRPQRGLAGDGPGAERSPLLYSPSAR